MTVELAVAGWESSRAWRWYGCCTRDRDSPCSTNASPALVRTIRPAFRPVSHGTSAVASGDEVVRAIYEIFAARGIRAITVSQALSGAAREFHTRELRMGESSDQGWSLGAVAAGAAGGATEEGEDDAESGSEEVAGLGAQ